ncbi:MAG: AAA family ATPase [Syntrophales bacterium]|jgi:putative ATPase|nr:AAA family ATPase [Syntrophales bacterium]
MNLFANGRGNITGKRVPLADRMRPRSFDEFIGQTHLVGLEGLLRQAVRSGNLFSMVLWGPPGCGKTTLARIIAKESNAYFETFSAVLSGV